MKVEIKVFLKEGYRMRVLLVSLFGILLFIWAWDTKYLFSTKFLTFLAILVALFNQSIQHFIDEPIIKVEFDKKSDRCYRTAVSRDNIMEFGTFSVERQYFRLKITNNGLGTAKRVRVIVDLFNKNKNEEERFEPNCLNWITGEKEIDIASGETTYINLLSHITKVLPPDDKKQFPNNFFVIRLQLFDLIRLRGLAWDKDKETYYIKVITHGDNINAKTYWFKYIPDEKEMFKAGELLEIQEPKSKKIK